MLSQTENYGPLEFEITRVHRIDMKNIVMYLNHPLIADAT